MVVPHGKKALELQLFSYVKQDVDQGLQCLVKFMHKWNNRWKSCIVYDQSARPKKGKEGASSNNRRFVIRSGTKKRRQLAPCDSSVSSITGFLFKQRSKKGNRGDFALAKSLNCNILTCNAPTLRRMRRYTVIRSAFVYKKTREKFGLLRHVKRLKIHLKTHEQNRLLRYLSLLRLPCECRVQSCS